MDALNCKNLRFLGINLNSLTCKCIALFSIVMVLRTALFPSYSAFDKITNFTIKNFRTPGNQSLFLDPKFRYGKPKFLEVPQIVWGLNNQKIAFARACLTARTMNRTLLMPSLSASLFYKELDLLQPVPFEEIFKFDQFNSRCKGFVQLGRYSSLSNSTNVLDLQKGSGRKWTVERDFDQLKEFTKDQFDEYETIRIVGKNPFLWHDHWPVKDYAKIFQCLVLVDEILKEADKVVSKISNIGRNLSKNSSVSSYVAVHMRIEKDWMIHCKKLEHKLNITEICSSKEEITQRVGHILGLETPIPIYLAVADTLLEDNTILNGWKKGLIPFEKKKLGVMEIYKKHPYLIQSAIDYEVCLRANVFVGNSFSTFSSLIVLERTQKMIEMGEKRPCGFASKWPSYAYNIAGDDVKRPRRWITNMSDTSLQAISYGSIDVSC